MEVYGARVPTPVYKEAEMVGEAVHTFLGDLDRGGIDEVVRGEGQKYGGEGCWSKTEEELEEKLLREEFFSGQGGRLRDVLKDVKRKAVMLKFEKGVTAVWDVWASEIVKKLVRTPEATVERYRCSLGQLVRIFEAVRADLPWKDRAKVRRHIKLAAKKVHNFTLKGVYPPKLPPADAWKSYGVRKVTEEMLKDLHIPKVVENFVRRRTMSVMSSAVKLRDFFCNFKELTLRKERSPCFCHMASEELPRVGGHVCARTTQPRSGPLAVLNRNLKDTPVTKVNFGESMEKAFTEYAVQFAGAEARVQNAVVLQLLPVTLTADECEMCMWHTVTCTSRVPQHWVELRDENMKLIFRVTFERFNRLLLRLVVWGELEDNSDLLGLCTAVARRMLFWVERITRDYWITPYPDQDVLGEVLSLTGEMLGTPFDMNANAVAFFTPYPEESIFGAGVDTYSHWWCTMGLANPIYTVDRILQTLEHAVSSAKMAKYDEDFRRTRWQTHGMKEMPKKLRELKDKLKGTAALRWKQKAKLEKTLEKFCAGTARLYLDRNAVVGALICQQRYFDLLVNERESSAALFEEVEMTATELVRDLEKKFNRAMLGTVAKFVKTGVFGATYALLKDKDEELQKYRPVQPNNRAPLAPLQNVAGSAIEFVVQEAGNRMTLGGTQRLKHVVEEFDAVSAAACGVYAFSLDVKDQFSNLEHKVAEKATHAMTAVAFDNAGETSLLVTVRGAKGVQCPGTASWVWPYGEQEFTMSLGTDNTFIHFWRQADDAIALVWTLTGTEREWKRLRGTLRGYRDDCYAEGMRVLMTGVTGSDDGLPEAVE
ncbi:hypothetical protein CYMTET_29172 [Cymbomonas tetramitiformis]|uniref:Uncharacterized protein n=1 Tax=Cymbomonas tetramitiformis TaxID=36881 RepID=A0AAE0KV82_9CHLO|nr:hypothetical protein CYMTET_29172 [Cymbomonas tetramitiformis]